MTKENRFLFYFRHFNPLKKKKKSGQAIETFRDLTFVIKHSFLKEKADLISTGDEIVGISLEVKTFLV